MAIVRPTVLATILLCPVLANGQQLPTDPMVDLGMEHRHLLKVQGLLDYNANSTYNELATAIFRGGYLDRNLRERSLGTLNVGRNTAGYVLEARATWLGPRWTKAATWRPLVDIAHHEQASLRFTRDLYELVFFGNAVFEGEKAILAPSSYEQIRYQTAGFGVSHRTGSYVRFDIVRGQSYQAADIGWASLFTGVDGRVLRSALLGNYLASDTAGGGYDRTNGMGLAISGAWRTHIRIHDKSMPIAFSMEDLGFVSWGPRSVQLDKDTLLRFAGFDLTGPGGLDNAIDEEELLDTLGLRYRYGGFTRLLPFRAAFECNMSIGARSNIRWISEYRFLPGYIPMNSLMASRRFGTRTQLGLVLGHGGNGGVRLGLAAKYRLGERVLLSLSTPQAHGFIAKSRGLGAAFSLIVAL